MKFRKAWLSQLIKQKKCIVNIFLSTFFLFPIFVIRYLHFPVFFYRHHPIQYLAPCVSSSNIYIFNVDSPLDIAWIIRPKHLEYPLMIQIYYAPEKKISKMLGLILRIPFWVKSVAIVQKAHSSARSFILTLYIRPFFMFLHPI
jgi:hypothetical protein